MQTIKAQLEQLIAGVNLTPQAMTELMRWLMSGELTSAQIAAVVIALRMKGESIDELTAAAQVMHEFASTISLQHTQAVDIVGTGGDQQHTFNVSTAVAVVTAACGAVVAKHGNRSVTSKSGCADVLELAGVNLNLAPAMVAKCIDEIGIGFMYAPAHHGAMQHAQATRKEIGVRTIFNLLGPLANPAAVKHHLIGVYTGRWLLPFAEVLKKLGSQHALIVHAEDGLDEISISAKTQVVELQNGNISQYQLQPEDFNLKRASIHEIQVRDSAGSLAMMNKVFANVEHPARDIVLLNAGAALYAADVVPTIAAGVAKAAGAIQSGVARDKFQQLIDWTKQHG